MAGADRLERPAGLELEWLRVGDEAAALAGAVSRAGPDLVVHAAFVNKRPPGWSEEEYLERQLVANRRLFERCAAAGLPLVLISSSAVYGAGSPARPLDEAAPRRPLSLYGRAKALQEELAEEAAAAGMGLCILRLFNLVGPGQGPGMIVSDWVSRVAAIADGAEPVLRVKNRATSRDFVDVRDAARAVALAADRFPAGEVFNVASGRAVGLGELSELLEGLCPVPYRTIETDPEPAAADAAYQAGDAGKIARALGWRPEIDWRRSVRDAWAAYRGL